MITSNLQVHKYCAIYIIHNEKQRLSKSGSQRDAHCSKSTYRAVSPCPAIQTFTCKGIDTIRASILTNRSICASWITGVCVTFIDLITDWCCKTRYIIHVNEQPEATFILMTNKLQVPK